MPITVACDDPGTRVIVLTITDQWTWQDAMAALKQAIAIADNVGKRMYFACDLSKNSYMPPNGLIQAIQDMVAVCRTCPYTAGTILVFNKNQGTLRTMIATALENYGSPTGNYHYVSSLAEAYTLAQGDL